MVGADSLEEVVIVQTSPSHFVDDCPLPHQFLVGFEQLIQQYFEYHGHTAHLTGSHSLEEYLYDVLRHGSISQIREDVEDETVHEGAPVVGY